MDMIVNKFITRRSGFDIQAYIIEPVQVKSNHFTKENRRENKDLKPLSDSKTGINALTPDEPIKGTVLLVHGFASNAEVNWSSTGWFEALHKAGFRVLAFDHRGHGHSQASYHEANYTPELMAEDAIAVMDEAGVQRAHVIGYSMGARVSAALTALYPERVDRAVLAGLGEVLIKGQNNHLTLAEGLEAVDESTITDPSAKMFRRFATLTRSDLKALAACMRAPRHNLSPDLLMRIKRPVLIVVGDQDQIAGPVEPLQSAIPGAQLTRLKNKDHMSAVGAIGFKQAAMDFFQTP